jgi:hypothetical protein
MANTVLQTLLSSAPKTREVKTSEVAPFLTCPMCSGLFRDPVTLPECMHSFCRSCLLMRLEETGAIAEARPCCPTCGTPADSSRGLFVADTMLDALIDKLFPTVVAADRAAQAEMEGRSTTASSSSAAAADSLKPPSEDEAHKRMKHVHGITLHLAPATPEAIQQVLPGCLHAVPVGAHFRDVKSAGMVTKDHAASKLIISPLPPIAKPWLFTPNVLRMDGIRQFLAKPCGCKAAEILLFCSGQVIMGKEHSVEFIQKTKFQPQQEPDQAAVERGAGPKLWLRISYARRITPDTPGLLP